MSLADSILQTASIVRCVSIAATATDHTIFTSRLQAEARLACGEPGRLLASYGVMPLCPVWTAPATR